MKMNEEKYKAVLMTKNGKETSYIFANWFDFKTWAITFSHHSYPYDGGVWDFIKDEALDVIDTQIDAEIPKGYYLVVPFMSLTSSHLPQGKPYFCKL